jgi:hypothetical protein
LNEAHVEVVQQSDLDAVEATEVRRDVGAAAALAACRPGGRAAHGSVGSSTRTGLAGPTVTFDTERLDRPFELRRGAGHLVARRSEHLFELRDGRWLRRAAKIVGVGERPAVLHLAVTTAGLNTPNAAAITVGCLSE